MRYPCSKNVCKKTISCFSFLLFEHILNALLYIYYLYHQKAHILTFPCHTRYICNNTKKAYHQGYYKYGSVSEDAQDTLSIFKCFSYCSIFNEPAYKMRIFGHVQTPPPPLYAFVCINVNPPTHPLGAYVINGRPPSCISIVFSV